MTTEPIRPTRATTLSIRMVDAMTAMIMILLTSPLFVYAMLRSTAARINTFESVYIYGANNRIVALHQFTYSGHFKSLPILFNLLVGDISLLGRNIEYAFDAKQAGTTDTDENATPQFDIKPGLTSIEKVNNATGLGFEASQRSLNKAHSSVLHYVAALLRAAFVFAFTRLFTPKTKRTNAVVSVLGIELDNWTMTELLGELQQACQSAAQPMQQYSFVNADCLNISTKNESYRQCLQQSNRVFADGFGVRLACLTKGLGLKDNLNGTDMFPRLCQLAAEQNLSIFLLGGNDGVAATAASNMQNHYPNLTIAGCHSGYFDVSNAEQNDAVINEINHSNADILLVAMGAPLQDQWLEDNKQQLNCQVGIGVGGLFDFYSNRIKRAPLWLRQMGMEWTYRLLQEPARMWKRYIIGNPAFLMRVWKENRQLNKIQNAQPVATKLTNTNVRYAPTFDAKQANTRRALHSLRRQLNLGAKRMLDITVSAILLALLMPFFMLLALMIRIESKGAVLFCQTRAGRNNHPFTMWKFRSMYQDAEQRLALMKTDNEMQGGVIFKMKRDPRITLIGKFIRKASIDELPQLWNVLKGDMSLVGPRPALLSEVKQYSLHDRNRLMVKPGITCIWQVSGRSNIPFDKQVELDIDYIYQQSITADIWLLVKTIPAVLFARGAY
ncbi:WecB/TagA/CpsF family glycosyltransferase [Shewanella youngdeokensis]|uniref:WecB/TagA/CpsF family glycosyltransferase n=1 Tax=Shewanella youngdeokensis TaxID=2999068 RepID=A0ABZ0K3B4_9GAMM|nr:WecB/TagA/CpsF family glycosyltransferase [Shewanella sp. DAU334]